LQNPRAVLLPSYHIQSIHENQDCQGLSEETALGVRLADLSCMIPGQVLIAETAFCEDHIPAQIVARIAGLQMRRPRIAHMLMSN